MHTALAQASIVIYTAGHSGKASGAPHSYLGTQGKQHRYPLTTYTCEHAGAGAGAGNQFKQQAKQGARGGARAMCTRQSRLGTARGRQVLVRQACVLVVRSVQGRSTTAVFMRHRLHAECQCGARMFGSGLLVCKVRRQLAHTTCPGQG